MQENINKGHQPFHVDNAVLAFCLWRAGIPFWDPKEPCQVVYTLEMLRKMGCYEDWDPVEAVKDAHKRKVFGRITYGFVLTERLQFMTDAFREMVKELARDDISVDKIVKTIIEAWVKKKIETDEMLFRLACVDLKTRIPFMELWQQMIPCLEVPNDGEIEEIDEGIVVKDGKKYRVKRVDHPGFRTMSVNASPETRERLGI